MSKYDRLELLDHCEEQTTIRCTKCKEKDVTNSDALDSYDALHSKGWRVIENKAHCPKCAKKAKK